MKKNLSLSTILFTLLCVSASAQTITNFAGVAGSVGYNGDSILATAAELNMPYAIFWSPSGNLYIAEAKNNRIRKVDEWGIIYTVAGNGTAGFSGDGGVATDAELNNPTGIYVDSSENLYIADNENYCIRKVDGSTGIINTVAGIGGSYGFSGDGSLATWAKLQWPSNIAFDNAGHMLIADFGNDRIRQVDTSTGIITTILGGGTPEPYVDSGLVADMTFAGPKTIRVDKNGLIFFSASDASLVYRYNPASGYVTPIAGTGVALYTEDGGPATDECLDSPYGIYLDSNDNLYIADLENARVRYVNAATGIMTTFAGNGEGGFGGDGGPATEAQICCPLGVYGDPYGNIYIAENEQIRKVSPLTDAV